MGLAQKFNWWPYKLSRPEQSHNKDSSHRKAGKFEKPKVLKNKKERKLALMPVNLTPSPVGVGSLANTSLIYVIAS